VRLPGSDAARWRAMGVPALCYGPQAGLASGPDDHVHEADMQACAVVYALAAADFLGGE
jgi:succinyl-diaminopimelate desuccinylase